MKIGVTATQRGLTAAQIEKAVELLFNKTELHHGDCIGGDAELHELAKGMGMFIVVHPPLQNAKRAGMLGDRMREPKDYIARNHDIVDETERLLAFPRLQHEEARSGTWATVRYARKIGREVIIVYPDGSVE